MEFSHFTELVSKLKKIPLAGEEAHQEMLPSVRERSNMEAHIKRKPPLRAGVMALFFPDPAKETRLMLILRKTYKGVHSGQIGFPGGRVEIVDNGLKDTALRETYEEIGVRPSNITVIRELTKVFIPPSNFWVHPFVGYVNHTPRFKRQESEVEELIFVKLEDLMNDECVVHQVLSTDYMDAIEVPAFLLNQKIVWGATAMMLNEVKHMLAKVL